MTERAITTTIRDIARTKANLMTVSIAHRLSTIVHADRIYVLAHGKVVAKGNHAALLKKGGLYAALWREQSEVGEEEEALARPATTAARRTRRTG